MAPDNGQRKYRGLHTQSIAIGALGVLLAIPAVGQELRFEVASIKASPTDSLGPRVIAVTGLGGQLRVTNSTLAQMILHAYELREDQLFGGPDWVRRTLFDVTAKAAGRAPRQEVLAMFRSLLEDRFGLRLRQQLRDRPFYRLVVRRDDGRLGPDLRRAPVDCMPSLDARSVALMATTPNSTGARPSISGRCEPLATLVRSLERSLRTTVVDGTGLAGAWDYAVAYGELRATANVSASGDRPSLITAVEEQLGLRLESRNGPVEVFAIEAAEVPSAD